METFDKEVWSCESSNRSPKVSSILSFHIYSTRIFHTFSDLVMLNCPCSIPTTVSGDDSIYSTDIYMKEPGGKTQKLAFGKVDAACRGATFWPPHGGGTWVTPMKAQ